MASLFGKVGELSILASGHGGLSEEDARILRGLRAGIEGAYEELIEKYEQPVYSLVYRLTGNPSDACDVAQEVFLKVFRGVHAFREQSSLRTWIYRIAVNEAHNRHRWWVRHGRREVSIERDTETGEARAELARDPGRSPYDQAVDSENRALLERALAQVKPLFRTAVVLRDVQNFSYEEIADILQVSIGTVKSRILRGREALRKQLTTAAGRELAELMVIY